MYDTPEKLRECSHPRISVLAVSLLNNQCPCQKQTRLALSNPSTAHPSDRFRRFLKFIVLTSSLFSPFSASAETPDPPPHSIPALAPRESRSEPHPLISPAPSASSTAQPPARPELGTNGPQINATPPSGELPNSPTAGKTKKGRALSLAVQWVFHSGSGIQVGGTYGFQLTRDFEIGILTSLRYFPATTDTVTPEGRLLQAVYGLTLQHAFHRVAPEWLGGLWVPYAKYGLLMQITWAYGRPGTATNHDTLLAFGMQFRRPGLPPFFLQAGYHLSHLRHFDQPLYNLSTAELGLGVVIEW